MERKISDLTKNLKSEEFLLDEDTTEFTFRNNSLSSVYSIERIACNLQVLDLSYNLLVDITPLAVLGALQKLNLEYNQIASLTPLKSLKLLQYVNLKCNKLGLIMGPGDSAMNGSLGPLISLKYLSEVFLEGNMPLCSDHMWLFSTFKVLGRPLDADSSGTPNPREVDLVVDGVSQRDLEATDNDVSSTSGSVDPEQAMKADEANEQMHDKRLCEAQMACWQKEVRKNVSLRVHFERSLTREMAEHARFLQQFRVKQADYERTIMDLTAQVGRAESKCAGLQGKMKEFVGTIFQGITQTTDCVMYQIQYTKLVNVLDSMLSRVSNAEARVAVATTLVNEKMHQLRNENALLEANKRFFEIEKQQSGLDSAVASGNGSAGGAQLSSLLIPAVVESLFKALYKKLCCYQSDHRHSDAMQFGLVHCGDLFTILQHTPTIRTLLVSNLGTARYRSCLAQLTRIARLHDIQVDCGEGDACAEAENFAAGDAGASSSIGEQGYLTYGEMLLLLIPDPVAPRGSTGNFSHSELKELQRKKLYNDDLFSMIPLQIADARHGGAAVPIQESSGPDATNAVHTNKEISRLKRERSYLLERVQAQCRQFDRRAEGVRAHFEGQLIEKDVRIQHLGSSLTDANSSNKELARRLDESEVLVQDLRSAAVRAKSAADSKHDRLMEQLEKLQKDTVNKGLYAELTHVNTTLETELECLRSEIFKLKRDQLASARDLSRLQSEKDAVEGTGMAISQQLEIVKAQLQSSRSAEEKLQLDLDVALRSFEEQSIQHSAGDDERQVMESNLHEAQKREELLLEENANLKVQLKDLQADAEAAAAASLRRDSSGSRTSGEENVPPSQQGTPISLAQAGVALHPVAERKPVEVESTMPLSSSYLINRIHMLQAKLDKGIVE